MEPASARREIVLVGSGGGAGVRRADTTRRNPGRFRVVGIAGGGGNPDLVASQALEFGAEVVAVASEARVDDLRRALQAAAAQEAAGRARQSPKILAGPDAVAGVAAWPCDVVLNGVTGAVGLAATLAPIDAGRGVALANKESLITGGPPGAGRAGP